MRQRGKTEGIETLRIPVAGFQWNKGTMECVRQAGMYVDPGTTLWPYEFQRRRFTGYRFRYASSQASKYHIKKRSVRHNLLSEVWGNGSPGNVTFLFHFEAILVI